MSQASPMTPVTLLDLFILDPQKLLNTPIGETMSNRFTCRLVASKEGETRYPILSYINMLLDNISASDRADKLQQTSLCVAAILSADVPYLGLAVKKVVVLDIQRDNSLKANMLLTYTLVNNMRAIPPLSEYRNAVVVPWQEQLDEYSCSISSAVIK